MVNSVNVKRGGEVSIAMVYGYRPSPPYLHDLNASFQSANPTDPAKAFRYERSLPQRPLTKRMRTIWRE